MRLVVRHGVLAVGDHGELPLRARVPPDGRVDGAGERIGMPLHDRVVDLLDLAVVELALQLGVRTLATSRRP